MLWQLSPVSVFGMLAPLELLREGFPLEGYSAHILNSTGMYLIVNYL
jgi:hypothetical protein